MKKFVLGIFAFSISSLILGYLFMNSSIICTKDMAAKVQIKSLSDRVKEFRRDCNRLPTNEEGLQALISLKDPQTCPYYSKDAYIEGGKVPIDPWDQEFKYESDGRTFKISTKFDGKLFVNDGQDVKTIEMDE